MLADLVRLLLGLLGGGRSGRSRQGLLLQVALSSDVLHPRVDHLFDALHGTRLNLTLKEGRLHEVNLSLHRQQAALLGWVASGTLHLPKLAAQERVRVRRIDGLRVNAHDQLASFAMQQIQRLRAPGLTAEGHTLNRDDAIKKLRLTFPRVQLLGRETVRLCQLPNGVDSLVADELLVELVDRHVEEHLLLLLPWRRHLGNFMRLQR